MITLNLPTKNASKTTQGGSFKLNLKSQQQVDTTFPTQSPLAKDKKPTLPQGAEELKLPSGNFAYKTPSGSTHEFLPNGMKKITLDSQFGGGSYLVDPKKVGNVVNQGEKAYGGEETVAGAQRDHIIPQSLGGLNSETDNSNIRIQPGYKTGGAADQSDKMEKDLYDQLKSKKITLGQARLMSITFKNELEKPQPSQSTAKNFAPAAGHAVLDVAKGLVKPFVEVGTGVVNEGRNIQELVKGVSQGRKTFTDYSGATYNIPGYGKAEPAFTGKEKPLELARKAGGTGLEIATYFMSVPEAKGVLQTLETIGKKPLTEITAQEFKAFSKAYAKKLLLSSATLGTSFGTAQSLKEGSTPKETLTNILKSVGTVAAMEVMLAPVLSKVFSRGGSKPLEAAVDSELTGKAKGEEVPIVKTENGFPTESPVKTSEVAPKVEVPRATKKVVNTESPAEHPLAAEARKYKSADEFVKASTLTKDEMLQRGADGHLSKAYETEIPLSKIDGREPVPAMEGGYQRGTEIKQPIETVYNPETDTYTLYSGNHRVRQAEINGQKTIKAFVEDNSGKTKTQLTDIYTKAHQTPEAPTVKGTSKVGASIETKTVEKGLSDGFGDTAGYDKITIKDQAQRASDVMNRDIELAKKMVRGEVPIGPGLRPEMLIKAMEDHAQATGDVQLSMDIAKSPLVSETSVHAQAMRLLAERNPDSVVAKLREVAQARADAIKKRFGKGRTVDKVKGEELKKIKSEIAKKAPTKETWASFVESIKC